MKYFLRSFDLAPLLVIPLMFIFCSTTKLWAQTKAPHAIHFKAFVDKAYVSPGGKIRLTLALKVPKEISENFKLPPITGLPRGLKKIKSGSAPDLAQMDNGTPDPITRIPALPRAFIVKQKWVDLKVPKKGSYIIPGFRISGAAESGDIISLNSNQIFIEAMPAGGGTTQSLGQRHQTNKKDLALQQRSLLNPRAPPGKPGSGNHPKRGARLLPGQGPGGAMAAPQGAPPALQDIKPMEDLPIELFWFWVALGLVATLGLSWWLYRHFAPIKTPYVTPPLPAHVVALDRLGALKIKGHNDNKEMKRFHFELSHILRQYLEAQFHFPASDRTTEELEPMIKNAHVICQEWQVKLIQVLKKTDLVKFTDHIVARPNSLELLSEVVEFVDETRPKFHADTDSDGPAASAPSDVPCNEPVAADKGVQN